MRIIMHVDMNSYFATVEQQSNPFLRGKPICVAGKGSGERTVCAALSIEAKKLGLRGAMGVWEARQLCPDIIVVQADYAKYQFISRKMFGILESYTPLIEIFSIDEAFLDLTGIATDIAGARKIALDIKQRLKTEIGDYLTCSIGISHNKLLAKLASGMQKPDGLTVINKSDITAVFSQTLVEDICGIGPRLTHKLQALEIKFMSQIEDCPLERLINFFGQRQGKIFKLMGQGIDDSIVLPYYEYPAEKSFGHSYTLPKNIFKTHEVKNVLLKLAEKVGRRMRRNNVSGRTIQIYVRFFDYSGFSEQQTIPRFIDNGLEIYKIGLNMIKKIKSAKPIRMVSISVTNLQRNIDIPMPILAHDQKTRIITKALDEINDRYGEFNIFRASLTKVKDKIQNIPDGRSKRI